MNAPERLQPDAAPLAARSVGAFAVPVRRASVVYRAAAAPVHALHGVDVDVAPGEFVAPAGRSGCGKTKLLRVIADLESISAGGVSLCANKLLNGAPVLEGLLRGELCDIVRRRAEVVDAGVAAGRLALVDPAQLFFGLRAATQTCADPDGPVRAVLGRRRPSARDHHRAAGPVVRLRLRGCGLLA
jgi:energy-coupling factor transporter ATP-binding protein EcfA2